MRSRQPHPRQQCLDLAPRTHGGARPGAGRPRKKDSERGFIPHHTRATHRKGDPVHVTIRVRKEIPSLRHEVMARRVKIALHAQRAKLIATEATHFQVVHFTIQSNHIHLIVEAPNKRGIARGVAGLEVRIARSINKLLGRKGSFWTERYHRRDLDSRRDMRNVLRYVLLNTQKHTGRISSHAPVADRQSSAASFDGFARPPAIHDDPLRWPTITPRTWLLRTGWRKYGLIDPADAPRA